jgi:hypothetical protein
MFCLDSEEDVRCSKVDASAVKYDIGCRAIRRIMRCVIAGIAAPRPVLRQQPGWLFLLKTSM